MGFRSGSLKTEKVPDLISLRPQRYRGIFSKAQRVYPEDQLISLAQQECEECYLGEVLVSHKSPSGRGNTMPWPEAQKAKLLSRKQKRQGMPNRVTGSVSREVAGHHIMQGFV